MILHKFTRVCPRLRGAIILRSSLCTENNLQTICRNLNIDENKGKYLQFKYPVIKKLDEQKLKNLVQALQELGFPSEIIFEEPSFCSILPITLKFRFKVLEECGIDDIQAKHLLSYLTIVRKKSIGELIRLGYIRNIRDLEKRLTSYITQWPASITLLDYKDVEKFTLHQLRIKIIQRYLELMLDLSQEEFDRGLKLYPTIKHRPLQVLNETLTILQREILMPNDKIKSNLYLIHADPKNLRHILSNFKTIGGIDIKEILRQHPRLALKNYQTMIKTKNMLEEYGVTPEAQTRCFDLFTLSTETIKERLDSAKSIPEFNTFYNHPRFLKMIHYNNTALKRLLNLSKNNKKCLSLNILSGSSADYEVFEKAPGDRLGKGKDLVFCICQALGKSFSPVEIHKVIKRHPFWIHIPLIQVQQVYEKLNLEYSSQEIYDNCPILLYPWNKIRDVRRLLSKASCTSTLNNIDQINVTSLSKSQRLSLILYLLEKKHYFSGNGVWTDDKHRKSDIQTRNAFTTITQ